MSMQDNAPASVAGQLPTNSPDPTVNLPESVRRAAERANAYFSPSPTVPAAPAAAPDAPQPEQVVEPTTTPDGTKITPVRIPTRRGADAGADAGAGAGAEDPQPRLAPAAAPATPAAPSATPTVPNFEHQYHSMRGRYEQQAQLNGTLSEQVRELAAELVRTQEMLKLVPSRAQNPPQHQHLTPQDVETYTPELVDVMQRAARDAVAPLLTDIQKQNQQLARDSRQRAFNQMYTDLGIAVPDWRAVNENPRFLQWLSLPDVYANRIRHEMLNEALQAARAPQVVAFFKGFLAEEHATGQMTVPPAPAATSAPKRTAAVDLITLAAPGGVVPAPGPTPTSADKPVYTHKQISNFYNEVRRGLWANRESDRLALEQDIIAAGREGRVR